MKCRECLLVKQLNEDYEHYNWDEYPEWYREGKQCPSCGAGFIGEFGRNLTSKCSRPDSPDAEKVAIGECPHCKKIINLKNYWLESAG